MILKERDVHDGSLTAEFDVFDDESCWADLCAAQEVEVQGHGVRLVLFGEGCGEVEADYAHEDGGDIAAVWDCVWVSEGSTMQAFV